MKPVPPVIKIVGIKKYSPRDLISNNAEQVGKLAADHDVKAPFHSQSTIHVTKAPTARLGRSPATPSDLFQTGRLLR